MSCIIDLSSRTGTTRHKQIYYLLTNIGQYLHNEIEHSETYKAYSDSLAGRLVSEIEDILGYVFHRVGNRAGRVGF